MKNFSEEAVLNKAIEWYGEGGVLKDAAMELFDEDRLKSGLKKRQKELRKDRIEAREKELQEVLEESKNTFPIGTLIWSHDGSDKLPNLVISEPYIKNTRYDVPFGKYGPGEEEDERKSVFVDTLRISKNNPLERDYVSVEICLENMKAEVGSYKHRNHIINLPDFWNSEEKKRKEQIDSLNERISREKKHISELEKEFDYYDSYNPRELTEERIQEILKDYVK